MNTYDYFGEAKSLAEGLKRAGFPDHASEILGAMEESASGSEVFMMMRARLARSWLSAPFRQSD